MENISEFRESASKISENKCIKLVLALIVIVVSTSTITILEIFVINYTAPFSKTIRDSNITNLQSQNQIIDVENGFQYCPALFEFGSGRTLRICLDNSSTKLDFRLFERQLPTVHGVDLNTSHWETFLKSIPHIQAALRNIGRQQHDDSSL